MVRLGIRTRSKRKLAKQSMSTVSKIPTQFLGLEKNEKIRYPELVIMARHARTVSLITVGRCSHAGIAPVRLE